MKVLKNDSQEIINEIKKEEFDIKKVVITKDENLSEELIKGLYGENVAVFHTKNLEIAKKVIEKNQSMDERETKFILDGDFRDEKEFHAMIRKGYKVDIIENF